MSCEKVSNYRAIFLVYCRSKTDKRKISTAACEEDFSVFSQSRAFFRNLNHSFWPNFLQNIKIVCLSPKLSLGKFECAEFSWDVKPFSLGSEIPNLGKLGSKKLNYMIKMKHGAQSNSNMLNSMVMFACPVLKRKYTYWANLTKKIKIVYFFTIVCDIPKMK